MASHASHREARCAMRFDPSVFVCYDAITMTSFPRGGDPSASSKVGPEISFTDVGRASSVKEISGPTLDEEPLSVRKAYRRCEKVRAARYDRFNRLGKSIKQIISCRSYLVTALLA